MPLGILALQTLPVAVIEMTVGAGLALFAFWRLSALGSGLWQAPCRHLARQGSNGRGLLGCASACARALGFGGAQAAPRSPAGSDTDLPRSGSVANFGRVAYGMEAARSTPASTPLDAWQAVQGTSMELPALELPPPTLDTAVDPPPPASEPRSGDSPVGEPDGATPRHRGTALAGDVEQGALTGQPAAAGAATLANSPWQEAPTMDTGGDEAPSGISWMCCSVTLCGHEIQVCGVPIWDAKSACAAFQALTFDATARWEALVLLLAGIAAGLGGGSIGINGPPIVVAFTILRDRLSKDDMRAISVSYFLIELVTVRLPLLISSGLLNLPIVTCLGIAGAALCGLALGSSLRSFVDTDSIILVLVVLVHVSAWLMLVGTAGSAVGLPLALTVSAILGGFLGSGLLARWWGSTRDTGLHGGAGEKAQPAGHQAPTASGEHQQQADATQVPTSLTVEEGSAQGTGVAVQEPPSGWLPAEPQLGRAQSAPART